MTDIILAYLLFAVVLLLACDARAEDFRVEMPAPVEQAEGC